MDTIKIDTILLINIKQRLHWHYLPIISSSLSLLTCKEAKSSYNKNPNTGKNLTNNSTAGTNYISRA